MHPAARTRRPVSNPTFQLYGWDSKHTTWHGPNALSEDVRPSARLLKSLQSAIGTSWFGPLACCSSEPEAARFFTLIHDLNDCAMSVIYCDESKAGPAEIVAVIPAGRRVRIRPDFAFEFLAFCRFLGVVDAGHECQVHDAIAAAIAEAPLGDHLVFSFSSGLWPDDLDHVLSYCVEKVAVTLCKWLD